MRRHHDAGQARLPFPCASFITPGGGDGELGANAQFHVASLGQEKVKDVKVAHIGLALLTADAGRGGDRQGEPHDLRHAKQLVRHGAAQQQGIAILVGQVVEAADVGILKVETQLRSQGVIGGIHVIARRAGHGHHGQSGREHRKNLHGK